MPQPALHRLLLPWYRKNARSLPWRETSDPYKIWISEIMLQQTQVQTVIPYYEKWLKRFPDISSLAKAPEAEVMKYWAGLGYYRRARMIHKASRLILENNSGKFPSDPEKILELPGIGRYTAGAISSIAFGLKQPILDGNVIRILTRIFGIGDDIAKPKTIEKLWKISESVLPEKNTGDFNQAMMELGATVCSPKSPNCGKCPTLKICTAYREKSWSVLPFKTNREKLEKISSSALVLRNNEKVLIEKQPSEARWGGLWMFPHGANAEAVLTRFKLNSTPARKLTLFHGFTKYKVRLDVYEAGTALNSAGPNLKWVKVKDLEQVAFPSPHKKIAKAVLNDSGS